MPLATGPGCPSRRTTQGDLFKRDWERLSQDPLLNASPTEGFAELPDAGFLAVALGEIEGLIETDGSEWHAGTLPTSWEEGLETTLSSLWTALPRLSTWDAAQGRRDDRCQPGNPYPSVYLLALLLLTRLPQDGWAIPSAWNDGSWNIILTGVERTPPRLLKMAVPVAQINKARSAPGLRHWPLFFWASLTSFVWCRLRKAKRVTGWCVCLRSVAVCWGWVSCRRDLRLPANLAHAAELGD